MLIFDRSQPGRRAGSQRRAAPADAAAGLPAGLLRSAPPVLPEVSEPEVVRHYTRLSQKNFSIDTQFYPLGSCTMKHNPRVAHRIAGLPGFARQHPRTPDEARQGFLRCLWELGQCLEVVTGMAACSLAPMAGAQGEFAGLAMIRAYHDARGDHQRREILVPDAAHGTNPATATMCGFSVREIPTRADGDVDLDALQAALSPCTAGLMLTNPSTLGIFERGIGDIARRVHEAGGLLYYDGANLNGILGRARPGDMGFDVVHVNLHKTFATPHGGGGPGAGPVGVVERLRPFLPLPLLAEEDGSLRWLGEADCPQSIGRLSAFGGNMGVLVRAWAYARALGREGLVRVSEHAALNANYLRARLEQEGFEMVPAGRRAGHEFVISLRQMARDHGVTAMDFAKRLLDHGHHAPTTYFPLMVPECLLIEPTETEARSTLDAFVAAMAAIRDEALTDPDTVRGAPHTLPVRRLDDVRAARKPDLSWRPAAAAGDDA